MGKQGKQGYKRKLGRKGNKGNNGKGDRQEGDGVGKEEDPYGKEVEVHGACGKGLSSPGPAAFPIPLQPNYPAPLPAFPTGSGSIPSHHSSPHSTPCTANRGEESQTLRSKEERFSTAMH